MLSTCRLLPVTRSTPSTAAVAVAITVPGPSIVRRHGPASAAATTSRSHATMPATSHVAGRV